VPALRQRFSRALRRGRPRRDEGPQKRRSAAVDSRTPRGRGGSAAPLQARRRVRIAGGKSLPTPEELEATWREIQAALRRDVSEVAFEAWLEPLSLTERAEGKLVLSAPEATRSWVAERYAGAIARAAGRSLGERCQVEIVAEGSGGPAEERGEGRSSTGARGRSELNPRYTFDGFVISAGNRLAHASALAVAEQPAQAYNPLFLHGPPGLGKTHLLHAIGHYVRAYASELRVAYTTVVAFTSEFVAATRRGDFARFDARFRDVDVLLVDDVQFLARRAGTMEAFFHTFNALYESGRQIVLTSDRPPVELGGLEERLRERFKCGLVALVEPPDLGARATILRKRAHLDGITGIDEATIEEVARLAPESVRSLEGALIRLVAYTSLTGEAPTPQLARMVLGGLVAAAEASSRAPTIEAVKDATAEAFNLNPDTLDAADRRARPAFARQIAMYLARELTGESLPSIGAAFGGRRHATVSHACSKIEREISSSGEARAAVDNLKTRLASPR
jgi:chromosomal replication initiator protein